MVIVKWYEKSFITMPATKKDCLNATSYLGIRTDNGARHRPKSKIVPDWFVETTIFFVIMVSIFSKSQTFGMWWKKTNTRCAANQSRITELLTRVNQRLITE